MTNDTVDTNTTTTLTEQNVWVTGPDGEQIPNYEATFPTINEGEVVHGQVVRVDKDEVLVDIGYKSEGVIPVAELSIRRSVNPEDEVKLGDEVETRALLGQDQPPVGVLLREHERVDLVAELDFILGVHGAANGQLRDRDHAFGLVADVD